MTRLRIVRLLATFALIGALAASCGGADSTGAREATPAARADIALLFMGNSHTSSNGLPEMVAAMVQAALPGKSVETVVAPGSMFLDERATDVGTLQLLRSRNWSFVVLQAQKHSTSGLFGYSTLATELLIRIAREFLAVPILFPEWPRRGIAETQRIFDLFASIARRQPACVAPIGQAWDLAIARHPGLALYADDGNHSSPAGAFLTALIIATTITGFSPGGLPTFEDLGVDAAVQAQLRAIAAETVLVYRPRQWCPADP
jgi:hypothetical protein